MSTSSTIGEYLEENGETEATLTTEKLRRHHLRLLDGNGDLKRRWSIYKSLVFEVSLEEEGFTYHLSDGTWYRVADSLVSELRDDLDQYWIAAHLPEHDEGFEGQYNEQVGEQPGFVCLDRQNI